jgi:hypothetical protein
MSLYGIFINHGFKIPLSFTVTSNYGLSFPFDIINVSTTIDNTFIVLLIMLILCIILSAFRIPVFGFVIGAFTISFSAYALTDTNLPFYGLFNVFIAVVGAICIYLNAQKIYDMNQNKGESKLKRRF